MLRYTIVSIMNTNACSTITKMWNTAQIKCNGSCIKPTAPIKMKINSPAYKLPNKRSANENGLATKAIVSSNKLHGIKNTIASLLLELNG